MTSPGVSTATRIEDTVVDDAELAVSASEGQGEAFEELYRRHSRAAMSVARSVTSNREDAADAVAEAFTRALLARYPRTAFFRPPEAVTADAFATATTNED